MSIEAPYRQTHTISFHGCHDDGILSPTDAGGVEKLKALFLQLLQDSGFTVTSDSSGAFDIMARPFGEGCGYTVVAILSESSFGLHTYPELKYGRLAEVEFNLCYLTKDHGDFVKEFKRRFVGLFKPSRIEHRNSPRRHFVPA